MKRMVKRVFGLAALGWLYLCSAGSAEAETVFTVTIGLGDCEITDISGATPAVVTVSSISACNITANGQEIAILGAWNTGTLYSNLNLHRANSSDTNGRCRVVAGLSGNTFQVKACDGTTNITNNGTYLNGGRVARGQFRTLNANLIRSAAIACLQDTSSTGCMHLSRLGKQALDLITIPSLSAKHADNKGVWTMNAILRWYAAGKPSSGAERDLVREGLLNSLGYLFPVSACDGNNDCGQPASSYVDFAVEVYGSTPIIIALGFEALSGAEQQQVADLILGDLPWTSGGFNYTGTTLSFPAFKSVPGVTLSWNSTTTVTVTGGDPVAAGVVVGDWIDFSPEGAFALWREVCAVNSSTITLCTARTGYGSGSGTPKWASARNPSTDVGWLGMVSASYYASLCGVPYPDGFPCPGYPPTSGSGGFEQFHNHNLGRINYPLNVFLALAPYDERARWAASVASFVYHQRYKGAPTSYAGMYHADRSYGNGRIAPYVISTHGFFRDAFTDAPELLGTGNTSTAQAWADEWFKYQLTNFQPGRTTKSFQSGGEDGGTLSYGAYAVPGLMASYFWPSSTYTPWLKQFFQTDWGESMYTAATLAGSGDGGLSAGDTIIWSLLGENPTVTASRATTTSFVTDPTQTHADCVALKGTGRNNCPEDTYFFAASRAGTSAAGAWNSTSLIARFVMSGFGVWDHAGQQHAVGTTVAMNGKVIMGGDGADGGFTASTARGGNFVVGGNSNTKQGPSVRLAKYATDTLLHASVDTTGQFTSGVTAVRRAFLHAKPGGGATGYGYSVEHDTFSAPSSTTADSVSHFYIAESCGTPSSSSCITLDRTAKTLRHNQTGAVADVWWFGDCTVNTQNSSNTDGSYTGQGGFSFRVAASITGTSGNCYKLTRYLTSTATVPTVAEPSSSSHKIIEVRDTKPILFSLAPVGTNNLTSCAAFTAGHTGNAQFICNGLAAGTYKVQLGGADVSGCTSIAVTAESNTLECGAVAAGSITVSAVGAALAVTTTTLPDGTQGSAYSQSLSATGGTSPYTWSVVSGSLPTGLSLSSGGAITGTPSGTGLSSFTVRATDAASGTDDQALTITINASGGGAASTVMRGGVCSGCKIK